MSARAPLSGPRQLRHALSIFNSALAAANPYAAVSAYLKRIPFERYRNVYVCGAGKAAFAMAQAAERALGRRLTAGCVNVNRGNGGRLRRIEPCECGHPEPDANGVEGARRIAQLAAQAGDGDLLLCLISGGASALMPLPAAPVTLGEKQEITRLLLASGAAIGEINAVRKHISAIKGGQLARLAAPAIVETLLVSDVVGDSLSVIGSGPTAPDDSTAGDALEVLRRYGLLRRAPKAVVKRLQAVAADPALETPKPGAAEFARVRNTIIGSNRLALQAAARRAEALGYRTLILASEVEGEARHVARMHAAIAREIVRFGQPVAPPACIITGGETTVTLRGPGLGGRNQEFALAAAPDIAGLENVLVLSAGTDGIDGPTDAAGAWANGATLSRNSAARRFLDANDSYHYFEPLGALVKTGPTGANVMDIRIVLAGLPGTPEKSRRQVSTPRV